MELHRYVAQFIAQGHSRRSPNRCPIENKQEWREMFQAGPSGGSGRDFSPILSDLSGARRFGQTKLVHCGFALIDDPEPVLLQGPWRNRAAHNPFCSLHRVVSLRGFRCDKFLTIVLFDLVCWHLLTGL